MKFIPFTLTLVVAMALSAFTLKQEPPEILEIGAKAPKTDLKMEDVSGKMLSLNDIKKENGVLVIFSCNTCPFVVGNGTESEGWEKRYKDAQRYAADAGVGLVLVNPNEAKRDKGDSMDDMKQRAKEMGYRSFYVLDKNHELADAFGARTTPHVYLFDKDMKLVYKGAIDDNVNSAKDVKEHWLRDALNNLKEGKKIEPESTRQMGCSIKRVS